jgi:hypothetical protein
MPANVTLFSGNGRLLNQVARGKEPHVVVDIRDHRTEENRRRQKYDAFALTAAKYFRVNEHRIHLAINGVIGALGAWGIQKGVEGIQSLYTSLRAAGSGADLSPTAVISLTAGLTALGIGVALEMNEEGSSLSAVKAPFEFLYRQKEKVGRFCLKGFSLIGKTTAHLTAGGIELAAALFNRTGRVLKDFANGVDYLKEACPALIGIGATAATVYVAKNMMGK